MRIIIDIGHPAHVHYFRNFIKLMESKGHEFLVSARNRSIIHYLLDFYKIPYFNRGKGKNGILGKLFYMIYADIKLFKKALFFKPDVFVSFASPYAAQVAWILQKPHIVIDDTEHAKFSHLFYKPFSKTLLNPRSFRKDFGGKQIRFNSFTELFYLHSKYFSPKSNSEAKTLLGLNENEKYVLMRFVSWEANHDIGHSGMDLKTKKKVVTFLIEKGYHIFISTEAENHEPFFENYLITLPPEKMHDVMANASMLITEGATMASECAMLGIPAIYVNSLDAGTLRDQEDKYKLIHGFRSSNGVLEKISEILLTKNLSETYQSRRKQMLSDNIDVTAFLIWFIENYPQSVIVMKEDPDYQYKFK
jgi:uncharacterized protein